MKKLNPMLKKVKDLPDDFFRLNIKALNEFEITNSDLIFFYKYHSGLKVLSFNLFENLTDDTIEKVNLYIDKLYKTKWNAVAYDLLLDYNPIENYNTKELGEYNTRDNNVTYKDENRNADIIDNNRRSTVNDERNNNSRVSDNISENTDTSMQLGANSDNDTSTESIFGFNSTVGAESTATDTTGVNNSNEQNYNFTKNKNVDNEVNDNKKFSSESEINDKNNHISEYNAQNEQNDKIGKRNEDKNKNGFIGKTPADMLSTDLEYRKNLFLDIVLDDIDKIITIPVYA